MNFFNDEIHQEMIDMYKQFAEGVFVHLSLLRSTRKRNSP